MLVVRGSRVILPDGERPASIHIDDRSSSSASPTTSEMPAGAELFDAGDTSRRAGSRRHARARQRAGSHRMGRLRHRDARRGGRRRDDDRRHAAQLRFRRRRRSRRSTRSGTAARGHCHVDVAFWGGVVPGNAGELDALVDAGVRGFKCFLAPSGVDEFPAVDEDDLRARACRSSRGEASRCSCMLELTRPAFSALGRTAATHPTYQSYLSTRPPEAEVAAIELMVRLARPSSARAFTSSMWRARRRSRPSRARRRPACRSPPRPVRTT